MFNVQNEKETFLFSKNNGIGACQKWVEIDASRLKNKTLPMFLIKYFENILQSALKALASKFLEILKCHLS